MGTRHGREEDELHHHVGQTVYTTVHFTAICSPHCTVAASASAAARAPAHAVPPQAGTAAAGDAGNAEPSPKDTHRVRLRRARRRPGSLPTRWAAAQGRERMGRDRGGGGSFSSTLAGQVAI